MPTATEYVDRIVSALSHRAYEDATNNIVALETTRRRGQQVAVPWSTDLAVSLLALIRQTEEV